MNYIINFNNNMNIGSKYYLHNHFLTQKENVLNSEMELNDEEMKSKRLWMKKIIKC
jgi:hypothetical protein